MQDGYDLETLFEACRDLFLLIDKLQFSTRETGDFALRLKNAYDSVQGRPVEPDVVIYENNRAFPSRISIESRLTGQMYFFKLSSGQ